MNNISTASFLLDLTLLFYLGPTVRLVLAYIAYFYHNYLYRSSTLPITTTTTILCLHCSATSTLARELPLSLFWVLVAMFAFFGSEIRFSFICNVREMRMDFANELENNAKLCRYKRQTNVGIAKEKGGRPADHFFPKGDH